MLNLSVLFENFYLTVVPKNFSDSFQFVLFLLNKNNNKMNKLEAVAGISSFSVQRFEKQTFSLIFTTKTEYFFEKV